MTLNNLSNRGRKGLLAIILAPTSIFLSYVAIVFLMSGMATHEKYLLPGGYSGPQALLMVPCEAFPARIALLEEEETKLVGDLQKMHARDRKLVIGALFTSGVTLFWLSRDRKNAPLESSVRSVRGQLHTIDQEMQLRCN